MVMISVLSLTRVQSTAAVMTVMTVALTCVMCLMPAAAAHPLLTLNSTMTALHW